MGIAQRNLRLLGKPATDLNRLTGESGDVYYDNTTGTLRLYSGKLAGGVPLATQAYVNTAVSNVPLPNLTAYATKSYVTMQGYITSSALTGLATESYVTGRGYVTQSDVNTSISELVNNAPSALNTLNELAAALGNDASYASTITTALSNKAPTDSPAFTGTATFRNTADVLSVVPFNNTTDFDVGVCSVFSVTSPGANFTANFANVPTTDNRAMAFTIIVSQGSTPYIPIVLTIDGASQTIKWQGTSPPSGDANKINIFSFIFLRQQSAWTVIGSSSTYG